MLALAGLGILLIGFILQRAMPQGFPVADQSARTTGARESVTEIYSRGPLRLNELMASNSGAIADENGLTPDWVEIANIGSGPVNLKGYILAHNAKAGNVFVFPDMVLEGGACAVVFADGRLSAESGHELHAPFRLSSMGDVLMLFNPADVAIDTVNIPSLADGEAYVRTGQTTWKASLESTPGLSNDTRFDISQIEPGPVRIVEFMAASESYAPDENGVCRDYAMIGNATGADVDIGGWSLSDDIRLPRLWRFPAGTVVPANGTLIVYCSGLNRESGGCLHTGFRLSSEGEQLVLTDASGRLVDAVEFDVMKKDAAWVRASDGSWTVGQPSAEKG